MDGIVQKYHPDWLEETPPAEDKSSGGQSQPQSLKHEAKLSLSAKAAGKKGRAGGMNPVPPSRRQAQTDKMPVEKPQEVKSDGQA